MEDAPLPASKSPSILQRAQQALEPAAKFLKSKGIPPAAGLLAVMVALLVVAYSGALLLQGPAHSSFAITVNSAQDNSPVEGALVQLYSPSGQLVASSVTISGKASFNNVNLQNGLSGFKVVVTKQGFSDSAGNPSASVSLNSATSAKPIVVLLYPSGEAPSGQVPIIVMVEDSRTLNPVTGASILASDAQGSTQYFTTSSGQVTVDGTQGAPLKLLTTASSYTPDSRTIVAISGNTQVVKLSPTGLASGAGKGALSDSPLVITSPNNPWENVTLTFYDQNGNPAGGNATITDPTLNQVVYSLSLSNGAAALPLFNPDYQMSATDSSGNIIPSGKVVGSDTATGNQLFSQPIFNGEASLPIYQNVTINVPAADGTNPPALVRVYDLFTGAQLQSMAANGSAMLMQIPLNEPIAITAYSPYYLPAIATDLFGTHQSETLSLGVPTSQATTFNVTDSSTNQTLPADLRIYSTLSNTIPVAEFDPSFTQPYVAQLDPSQTYYATASASGYVPLTTGQFAAPSTVQIYLGQSGNEEGYCTAPINPGATDDCTQDLAPQAFDVLVNATDPLGNPLPGVSASLQSGYNTVATNTSDQTGTADLPSIPQGQYLLTASYASQTYSQNITVASSNQVVQVQFNPGYGYVIATAQNATSQGQQVYATFALNQQGLANQTCTGLHCVLEANPAYPFTLSASAQGFEPTTIYYQLAQGQNASLTLLLQSGSNSPVQVQEVGVFDQFGSPVQTIYPGTSYTLELSVSAPAGEPLGVYLRAGDSPGLSAEYAGINDFTSSPQLSADSYEKSTSYNPGPICVDEANSTAQNGLLKWIELDYSNSGTTPFQRVISIPFTTKPSTVQGVVTQDFYYNAWALGPSGYVRFPTDSVLQNNSDSPTLAGCYASTLALQVPINPPVQGTCIDGTQSGSCSSTNPPNYCSYSNGQLSLSPNLLCCPGGTNLSDGACVGGTSTGSGSCQDGTPNGDCSQINKPLSCQAGTLSPSASCCPSGTSYQSGYCIPNSATGCTWNGQQVPQGCVAFAAPWECLDGSMQSDPITCGCPAGQIESGNSCTMPTCPDGTQSGVCSQVPTSEPLYCGTQQTSPTLFYNQSANCPCPAGEVNNNGVCSACTGQQCTGLFNACYYNGASVPVGCIAGSAPARCLEGGDITYDPVACGCQPGYAYNPASGTCMQQTSLTCPGGIPAGEGQASCDPNNLPNQCVLTSSGAAWAQNPDTCGCPTGMMQQGNACVETQGSGSTTTTTTTSTTSTTLAAQSCQNPLTCIARGQSDQFCNQAGQVTNYCNFCNPTCGGNQYDSCSLASGSCTPITCSDGTPVNQCSPLNPPMRCQLSQTGNPVEVANASLCSCPQGEALDPTGSYCQQCTNSDCSGQVTYACTNPTTGAQYQAGCLPSSIPSSSGAVLRCEQGGSILPDPTCGCQAGYSLTADGKSCVMFNQSSGSGQGSIPPSTTCPSCSGPDSVFYNPVTQTLATQSGQTTFSFQIDPVFPADAMNFTITEPQSPGGTLSISETGITSTDGSDSCFSFDPVNNVIKFDTRALRCPIAAIGNGLYWTMGQNKGQPFTSATSTMTLSLNTLPPASLPITLQVSAAQINSLYVNPTSLSGDGTAELIYILNEKQSSFGGRQITLPGASSPLAIYGAGVQAISWHGPGTLTIGEAGAPAIATLTYQNTASYFDCTGQLSSRLDSCTQGDFQCCANGWCDSNAIPTDVQSFESFAQNLAAQTAFRRGNGMPYAALGNGVPFQAFTAAQVIQGGATALTSAGFSVQSPSDCVASNPGAYSLEAQTSDGTNWQYSGSTLGLTPYDYVAGTCGSNSLFTDNPKIADPGSQYATSIQQANAQPLCNFLYGTCSCVAATNTSSVASNTEAADSSPYEVDSPFLGAPPVFNPLSGVAALYTDTTGQPILGNSFATLLANQLIYYQPYECKYILAPAYSAKQKATNSACNAPSKTYWSPPNPSVGSFPGVMPGTPANPCTAQYSLQLGYSNPGDIVTALRNCENTEPISYCQGQITNFLQPDLNKINAGMAANQQSCQAQCNANPTCSADSQCLAACSLAVDNDANAATASIEQGCQNAITGELSAGNACEAAKGEMMDLPVVLPIPRTAWGTCYAYSTGCAVACQPKKAYLEVIPVDNRLYYVAHYGLDAQCNPVAPTLFSSFMSTPTNSNYAQMALYSGASAYASGFIGNDYVQAGVSWVGAISAIASNNNCPIPPKPPLAASYLQNTCAYSSLEASPTLGGSGTNPPAPH